MSETIDLPAAHVVVVPTDVSDLDAGCAQPAASAVANLLHIGLRPGARVLILGQGTMGLLLLQAALAFGAAEVVTTAPRATIRDLSLSLGALDSLAPDDPELAARVAAFAPELVIDAAGGSAAVGLSGTTTLRQAIEFVEPYGTVLAISDLISPVELPPSARTKAIRLVFGQMGYYYGAYPLALGMLRDGRLSCRPIVTHQLEGLEALPAALEVMAERSKSGAIQVQLVLVPERRAAGPRGGPGARSTPGGGSDSATGGVSSGARRRPAPRPLSERLS